MSLRDLLFVVKTKYVVIYSNGYDGEVIETRKCFEVFREKLDSGVYGIEIADNDCIRIIL